GAILLGRFFKAGFVRLIAEEDIPGLYGVAHLFVPFGDDTAFHGLPLPGQNDGICHVLTPLKMLNKGTVTGAFMDEGPRLLFQPMGLAFFSSSFSASPDHRPLLAFTISSSSLN